MRFCLETASQALTAIESAGYPRSEGPAGRLLGRVVSELRFAELEIILGGDFHVFLEAIMTRCIEVSRLIQERYTLA